MMPLCRQLATAALVGSFVANMVPSFIKAPTVQASWCWAATGDSDSMFNCKTAGDIGSGSCAVAETCCGDYKCFQAGQCVSGGNPVGGNIEDDDFSTRVKAVKTANCPTPSNNNLAPSSDSSHTRLAAGVLVFAAVAYNH
jgi:hypothetical protein